MKQPLFTRSRIAALPTRHAEIVEGDGVAGLAREDFAVERFGIRHLSLLVQAQGARDQRVDRLGAGGGELSVTLLVSPPAAARAGIVATDGRAHAARSSLTRRCRSRSSSREAPAP